MVFHILFLVTFAMLEDIRTFSFENATLNIETRTKHYNKLINS